MKELHDLYWLALLIFLEARGENFLGKLAIAWVVMTRAEERKQSVQDVVLAAYQFSAFNTNDPNRLLVDNAPFSDEWRSCLRAAAGAYFALEENPAPRANHYLNPKAVKELPKWYRKDCVVRVIERHEFLKV